MRPLRTILFDWLMLGLVVTLVCLFQCRVVQSSTYQVGYSDAGGYTFRDGYWWKDGHAFNRFASREYYTYCGRKFYRTVYSYQQAVDVPSYAPIDPVNDPQWRVKLLDIIAHRDRAEAKLRVSALDHNEFLETIKVLGLERNFTWNGYGYAPNFASVERYSSTQQQQYSQTTAPQGATIYGYRELADIYGNVDLGELYNSVMRLRQQSYANESAATSETHALVDNLAGSMAAIKEIEAKGAAAKAVLEAASAKDRATLLRELWSTRQPGNPAPAPEARAAVTRAAVDTLIAAKCLACHNKEKPNGGLDLSDLSLLDGVQGGKILQRIIHPDPAKRMPLAAENAPGVPLTADEVAIFYLAAYGAVQD